MTYPWYDSIWLQLFHDARNIISDAQPHRLAGFEQAFAKLRDPGDGKTTVLKELLSQEVHSEIIRLIAELKKTELEMHEFLQFGRLVVHDHPYMDKLQKDFTDLVTDVVGEDVEPSYNFLSLYNNLGVCEPHMDAPTSKWTLDICIEQSDVWPIHISEAQDWPLDYVQQTDNWQDTLKHEMRPTTRQYDMHPGDAIIFTGSNQWHYRDRIPRGSGDGYCHLVFLHYIPKGSKDLLDPLNWASLFNLSSLDQLAERIAMYETSVDATSLLPPGSTAAEP